METKYFKFVYLNQCILELHSPLCKNWPTSSIRKDKRQFLGPPETLLSLFSPLSLSVEEVLRGRRRERERGKKERPME